ncbi:MAG: glycerophosphoryl diester phosphodiesterase [Acidimicrobiales bacterium]|nr:MAG: glycerophosphoryl diester phosphodiesterase [Acidimicrobiales bacterium]
MEAFARAVEMGYGYLETDVHPTRDGVLVAFHDPQLDRVTDLKGSVTDHTWEEIARARVRGGGSIPRLEDLLGEWPDVRLNVDCKSDESVDLLLDLLDRWNAWDRVLAASFSHKRLLRLRSQAGSRLATSLSPREVAGLKAAAYGAPWRKPHRAVAAQVPERQGPITLVDEKFVETAHSFGVLVHVWTVDEPHQIEHLLDLGVDGIMTDRPSVLKEVLVGRGLWRPPS